MAEETNGQRDLTKVSKLRPMQTGINIVVKVVNAKDVARGQGRFSECLVGDETGSINFTARNDQVNKMKEGATITLSNARIDMFRGSMRLAVDRFGRIEESEPASFTVQEDINMSLIEFERIDVVV